MDPIKNPFSPGAGSPPPELVGREQVLDQANILLERIKIGKPEKSMLLTGLRGVGKTVLLNEIKQIADGKSGFYSVIVEAHEEKNLASLLIPHLRSLLFQLDRTADVGDKAKRALAVLKGFVNSIKVNIGSDISIGLDIDPENGVADSGDLEVDLPNLFASVAEAASDNNAVIVLLIDEVQYLNKKELSALIMTMHKMQQNSLPVVLLGAGLPVLPSLAGESKSYAERLFDFPPIGPLNEEDAYKALQEPVLEHDVQFEEAALAEICKMTEGYPYFIQEWGYQAWKQAPESPISRDIILSTTDVVVRRLDENFFRVRFDRLTPSEKRYLRAMASLGPQAHKAGEVAAVLNRNTNSLGPVRSTLIKKGMIYSPEYGTIAFTVPLFNEFMLRAMPELS